MKHDPIIAMLRVVPGLAGQSDRDLAQLARLVDVAAVQPGDLLTKQGSYEKQIFLIVDGYADVLIGDEVVANLGPGDFVGEVAMLTGGPRTATVRARTVMSVLVVGQGTFSSFAWNNEISKSLSQQLANRLREADQGFRQAAGSK